MAVATFDTLKFANTLKAAGVPDKQAEAQAVAFAEIIQLNSKDLVTKDDLKLEIDNLRKDVKQELKDVEQRLSSKIELVAAEQKTIKAELKGDMLLLKWMFGAVMGMFVAIVIRTFLVRGPIG